MTKQQITKYLAMLNDQLAEMGIKGEICLYGGAAMCLRQIKAATQFFIEELFS
jgi:hypothetical protein